MSLRRVLLNWNLRLTEKPRLTRAKSPEVLRNGFERNARWFFRSPSGASYKTDMLADVPCIWARCDVVRDDAVILYFHGGGYVFGSPRTHRAMLAHLSKRTGLPACLPDYRLAPEHPFPAAVEDALAAYQTLLERGFAADRIVLGGDSAGGGLALVCLAEILRLDLPRPAGCFALSPLTDLTFSGASFRQNEKKDALLPASRAHDMSTLYLNGADPSDPRATPLNAEFHNAPPVWLTAGTTEILLDDARRMASHLRSRNVDVTEQIVVDLPHVWPIFHSLIPEAGQTLDDIATWVRPLVSTSAEN